MEDVEDDTMLAKQRLLKQQKKTELVAESSDTATIKKLHVSSANLQRVGNIVLILASLYPAFIVRCMYCRVQYCYCKFLSISL